MKKRDSINQLIAMYEKFMPETVYLKRNGGRYEEVIKAMTELQNFILTIEEDAKFKIAKEELIGTSLVLEVNCTLLSLTEVDEFCSAIKTSNAIDITPKTDGTLEILFEFKDAYVPVNPKQ